jgi:AraC family transcriptional regulator, ethanolamine operon transcriptional activator
VPDLASNWAFDRYSDNIREASVFFMKTGPSTADWSIELFSFERTVLQFGSDGGPRVVHGVSRPDAAIFMLQIAKTDRPVFFDGRALRWHDMAVLAPGSHFTFASHAPARWIAFSVANELIEDLLSALKVDKPVLLRNLAVSLSRKSAQEFADTVVKVRSLVQKSKIGKSHRAVERTLLESLRAILSDRNSELIEPDPQILTVEKRITIALEYVRSRPTESISVNDIVGAVGISARALYRCFQSYMKVAPKDYLRFRQLNLVRRALRLDTTVVGQKNPVTLILIKYGVSEFGRFAAEYRRLFKELPSQTWARRLGTVPR